MFKRLTLGILITALHGLFFIGNLPLPFLLQKQPLHTAPLCVVWLRHLESDSIEIPKAENPLERAQAITENLLKAMS